MGRRLIQKGKQLTGKLPQGVSEPKEFEGKMIRYLMHAITKQKKGAEQVQVISSIKQIDI
jgi:hypothetical protein